VLAGLGHTLTDLCQFDILQSDLGWQGTECNPIGTYDVLIAGQAMAPNLMGRRGRGERDDGAVVDASDQMVARIANRTGRILDVAHL
jgi:hypothetical protein